jgi:hypothetical protein
MISTDGAWAGFFQRSWWWRDEILQVLGTGKAYQHELLCLKNISVVPGINCLKNASQSWVQETYLEITNWNLWRLEKPKNHECSRVLKQTAFLPIVTTRYEHRWIGRFFKTGSTSTLFQSLGFFIRKIITTESGVVARQCPLSSKRQCTGFQ